MLKRKKLFIISGLILFILAVFIFFLLDSSTEPVAIGSIGLAGVCGIGILKNNSKSVYFNSETKNSIILGCKELFEKVKSTKFSLWGIASSGRDVFILTFEITEIISKEFHGLKGEEKRKLAAEILDEAVCFGGILSPIEFFDHLFFEVIISAVYETGKYLKDKVFHQ